MPAGRGRCSRLSQLSLKLSNALFQFGDLVLQSGDSAVSFASRSACRLPASRARVVLKSPPFWAPVITTGAAPPWVCGTWRLGADPQADKASTPIAKRSDFMFSFQKSATSRTMLAMDSEPAAAMTQIASESIDLPRFLPQGSLAATVRYIIPSSGGGLRQQHDRARPPDIEVLLPVASNLAACFASKAEPTSARGTIPQTIVVITNFYGVPEEQSEQLLRVTLHRVEPPLVTAEAIELIVPCIAVGGDCAGRRLMCRRSTECGFVAKGSNGGGSSATRGALHLLGVASAELRRYAGSVYRRLRHD